MYETREQIEFNDQTPLLEINRSKNGGMRGARSASAGQLDLFENRTRAVFLVEL